MKIVVVLSGGLDSTTLLYHLREAGHEIKAISICYGQRHVKELEAARRICLESGVEQKIVDLSGLSDVFGANALTEMATAVPLGEYDATIQATTVPNRNMILLSIAIGWTISLKFEAVAYGAHSGPYTPYPDCRPEFAEAISRLAQICDWSPIEVLSPFVNWNKGEIVQRGHELGAPFALTWSCYQGSQKHCGQCATCLDRKQAFAQNGLIDPVEYLA